MRIQIENGAPAAADAARKGRLVMKRLQKITFAELRAQGVYGVYCQDYRCSQSIKVSADPWPDHDDEPPVQFALSPARPSFSNRGAAPMPWPRPTGKINTTRI
jgi:transposase-like protein